MRNVTRLCYVLFAEVLPCLFSLIRLQFSKMAEKGDKDVKRKGQELWRALKDPLDRKRIQELLEDRAPTNFREPGTEVKCVNLLLFYLF